MTKVIIDLAKKEKKRKEPALSYSNKRWMYKKRSICKYSTIIQSELNVPVVGNTV
jgi:hypothetical protein